MCTAFARALRSVTRTPAFSVTVIGMLAVGIGATTAMFALVDAVLLRELPYPHAERLVSLGSRLPNDKLFAGRRLGLSQAQYFFLANESRSFDGIGAYDSRTRPAALTGNGAAERVETAYATASLFRLLGLRAVLGRPIGPDDDVPGAAGRVVVLGHDLWVHRYGSDPGIVGSTIVVDEKPARVLGVLEPDARLPDRKPDLWFPLGADPSAPARNIHFLSGVARIRDALSLDAVQRDMTVLTAKLPEVFPSVYRSPVMRRGGFTTDVVTLKANVIGSTVRVLWILLGSVALVLVIACANAANLFLVRAHARRRESAIHSALGAGFGHLARQYMLEAVLISAAAGTLGAVLAFFGLGAFIAAAPWDVPRLEELRFHPAAALFAVLVALAAGILFGVLQLPGLTSISRALKEEGRGTTLSRRQRAAQRVLVVGQVAIALVLLASCGIMVRTVYRLQNVQHGFSAVNVLAVDVSLPRARYRTDESASAAWKALTERLSTLPGVVQVAATSRAPLDGRSGCSAVFVEGRESAGSDESPACVSTVLVTPGFFATLRIPVRGAPPNWQDNDARTGSVVVSRALAKRFWPSEDPIGKGIRANGSGPPYYRVVGVAGDVLADGLDEPPVEAVYFPLIALADAPLWDPPREMTLLLRATSTDAAALAPSVRRLVSDVEPSAPITRIRTMDAIMASATVRVRFITSMLVGAAAVALLLSCVGLYSVIAYITIQRRGEIGIRLALGAQSAQILRSVVGQSLILASVGVIAGALASIAVTRVLRALVPEVQSNETWVLTAASLLLLASAALAGYLPARDAAGVPATEVLR